MNNQVTLRKQATSNLLLKHLYPLKRCNETYVEFNLKKYKKYF